MAPDNIIDHFALVPLFTTWFLTLNFLGSFIACALLSTVVISEERGSSCYIVTIVQAATLGVRDTLCAAEQEAVVTDTGFHTAFVAIFASIWVITGGIAGTATKLIMAVLRA